MEPKPVLIFRYAGRFAHFLRAEASASALSYPVPPRTVLLGVIGAVLGMSKDTPQTLLGNASIAVSGAQPSTHWHRAKFRKELPTPLPSTIKIGTKGSDKPEKATLIKQEWLVAPDYRVTVNLPEPYHSQLAERLKAKAWHFSPCLGLSEMSASLEFIAEADAVPLGKEQTVSCHSVVAQNAVTIDGDRMLDENLEIQVVRMPRDVTPDRIFSHANYLVERRGRPIPIRTSSAWHVTGDNLDSRHLMFL